MEIKLHQLPEEVIHHMRDGDGTVHKRTYEDDSVRIMILTLEPGSSIGLHTHDTNLEIFYGLSGKGHVVVEGGQDPMLPGCCHYCQMGKSHSLVNDGDEPLSVFAVIAKHP